MKKAIFNKKTTIYFIGIGGISLSALASIMINRGCRVYGSDVKETEITKDLETLGAIIYYNQNIITVNNCINYVVYSGAISETDINIKFAIENNIKVLSRGEFLGILAKEYKTCIAVAGTHGKTTTTAILSEILINNKLKPTVHIGGEVVNLNGNYVVGRNDFFITEACEFKNAFGELWPNISIVTNIEKDHLDCYGSFLNLKNAFKKFAIKSEVCFCDYKLKNLLKCNKLITVSLKNTKANYYAKNIVKTCEYCFFDVLHNGSFLGRFKCKFKEDYNILNCIFAIACSNFLKVEYSTIFRAVLNFNGVKRRNEKIGKINNALVVCDYAHHPTEIYNFLKNKNLKNSLIIFQPHTYSRTLNLFKDFVNVLNFCSNIIIFKTYAARENCILGATETDLFNAVNVKNKKLILSNENLEKFLIKNAYRYSNIYAIGAGDIYDVLKAIILHYKIK